MNVLLGFPTPPRKRMQSTAVSLTLIHLPFFKVTPVIWVEKTAFFRAFSAKDALVKKATKPSFQ